MKWLCLTSEPEGDGERRRACPASRDGANPRERPGSRRPTTWTRKHSQLRASANGENPSHREPQRRVRKPLPMRSQISLVANKGRGSVNRSPQGAIRGGFAVSAQESACFARCSSCDGALARTRRERRASAMSAAWDSSPALSPVPWGERSREVFNCVPGDQQSAPLINSFGVCGGAEPVDHRGDGSRGATNGTGSAASQTERATSERRRGRGRRRASRRRRGRRRRPPPILCAGGRDLATCRARLCRASSGVRPSTAIRWSDSLGAASANVTPCSSSRPTSRATSACRCER
jgi:hypothetical protein